MIDGKTLVAVCEARSVQSCPCCDNTPKELGKKENIFNGKFEPKENRLIYGLSDLHLWICCFEAFLNIGYKKITKDPRSEKKEVLDHKNVIKKRFLDDMKMKVDSITPQGVTNTGNVARRAFSDIEKFAKCLDFDEPEKDILILIRNILLAVSSRFPIDANRFRDYSFEICVKWFDTFDWYPMTPTVHKLLIHGSDIIEQSTLPIGVLSEQAAESRNKFLKNDRF